MIGLLLILSSAIAAPKISLPNIEQVVEKEGFIVTPSYSEIYRPGAMLISNDRGGHDLVVKDCVGVRHDVYIMSQNSISASLSAGVSAGINIAKGKINLLTERQTIFINPEQHTIPLTKIIANNTCKNDILNYSNLDLKKVIIVYDVLVAQIKNNVCTKVDVTGEILFMGDIESSASYECVTESAYQVPVGYKAIEYLKISDQKKPASKEKYSKAPNYPKYPKAPNYPKSEEPKKKVYHNSKAKNNIKNNSFELKAGGLVMMGLSVVPAVRNTRNLLTYQSKSACLNNIIQDGEDSCLQNFSNMWRPGANSYEAVSSDVANRKLHEDLLITSGIFFGAGLTMAISGSF
jgi:hypothetical protein